MDCGEIVKKHLEDNGFDGLYQSGVCACELSDLIPCGGDFSSCCPGHKKEAENFTENEKALFPDVDWIMTSEKGGN